MTSKYYQASLIEVQREWSIDDVADAHEALDYFDVTILCTCHGILGDLTEEILKNLRSSEYLQ